MFRGQLNGVGPRDATAGLVQRLDSEGHNDGYSNHHNEATKEEKPPLLREPTGLQLHHRDSHSGGGPEYRLAGGRAAPGDDPDEGGEAPADQRVDGESDHGLGFENIVAAGRRIEDAMKRGDEYLGQVIDKGDEAGLGRRAKQLEQEANDKQRGTHPVSSQTACSARKLYMGRSVVTVVVLFPRACCIGYVTFNTFRSCTRARSMPLPQVQVSAGPAHRLGQHVDALVELGILNQDRWQESNHGSAGG